MIQPVTERKSVHSDVCSPANFVFEHEVEVVEDYLSSLLHDLNLSAPAVFVLGVQLQATKFNRNLLS